MPFNAPFESFNQLDDAVQILIVVAVPLTVVGVAAVLGYFMHRIRKVEQRTKLMEAMIKRGSTPEEIAQVLLTAEFATPSGGNKDPDPEVRIVKHLNTYWYSGTDVERILEAAKDGAGQIDDTTVRIIESMSSHWTGTGKIVNVLRSRRAGTPGAAEQPAAS